MPSRRPACPMFFSKLPITIVAFATGYLLAVYFLLTLIQRLTRHVPLGNEEAD